MTAADFDVERGYFEPGYEQPNEAANEAIRLLARTEGLLTDPVYTGKALAGLIGHVREGRIAPGETVIFWHTAARRRCSPSRRFWAIWRKNKKQMSESEILRKFR